LHHTNTLSRQPMTLIRLRAFGPAQAQSSTSAGAVREP
jgi:hypothetical protein